MTIMIFNKTTTAFIKHINAAIFDNTSAIPYDVTMYDLTVQENVDCEFRSYTFCATAAAAAAATTTARRMY